ncbi:Vegetative incompatibility protein HET-E-1 [Symbiodinium microadriaticum]|uniref:Vegetative incompatibility protein HET-E-1 n=1 Tax=Symbiodinium microadriaticum TaxID=2951 RepID=A0A1Q9F4N2_SYMMI|nr:Vegetative incompatibility protein HET-E-1 [Symbiodinium microadriaticum]
MILTRFLVLDLRDGVAARVFQAATGQCTRSCFTPEGVPYPRAQFDKLSLRTLVGHASAVYAAAFTPDGSQVLTGSADTHVGLFDVATGRPGDLLTDVGVYHLPRQLLRLFQEHGMAAATLARRYGRLIMQDVLARALILGDRQNCGKAHGNFPKEA